MSDNSRLTDEEVVERIRSVDRELFAVIMARYQDKLLRYAANIVKDEQRALDVVQESFIKAFINLKGFDTKKKFSSWIYRIVHNQAMNVVKKYQKEIRLPDDMDFQSDESVEKDIEREEVIKKVEQCLENMPLLYSEPLALFYLDEKSYQEIGDILRIPAGTVATRISRAKILMRKICQKK